MLSFQPAFHPIADMAAMVGTGSDRERNREHAKRSRVRKKFLLDSLQKSVNALQVQLPVFLWHIALESSCSGYHVP